jgi:integrase
MNAETQTALERLKQWQAKVKEFRGELKTPKEWGALSAGSQSNYEQKVRVLAGRMPHKAAKCKQSYYAVRAAYFHIQSRAIRAKFNELDSWLKSSDFFTGGVTEEKARAYFDQVRVSGLGKMMGEYKAVASVTSFEGARKGTEQPTHGKRRTSALPLGWKGKLIGAVPRDSKYRAHVAAMALCGCRPSEFESDVLVTRIDADTFEFRIAGKKQGTRTKDGKTFTVGQSLRTITIKRTNDLNKKGVVNSEFLMLDKAMKGAKYLELRASATAIRDVVIAASKKAFPALESRPTSYSFRHAFASELKSQNGEASESTAAALGHASTKTQKCYGYSRSGGGGYGYEAQATGAIRSPGIGREASLIKSASGKSKGKGSTAVKKSYPRPAPSWAGLL